MLLRVLFLAAAIVLWLASAILLCHGAKAMRTRELSPRMRKLKWVCRARTEQELFVKIVERCFAFGVLLFLIGLLLGLMPFFAFDSN